MDKNIFLEKLTKETDPSGVVMSSYSKGTETDQNLKLWVVVGPSLSRKGSIGFQSLYVPTVYTSYPPLSHSSRFQETQPNLYTGPLSSHFLH